MNTRHTELVRLPLPAAGALQVYLSHATVRDERAVVYVHGFASTRASLKAEALEAACARRGWTFVSFDFRGHGESTGTLLEMTGRGLLDDMRAVHEYLIGLGVPRLCPVGSSMGGWAAAWFTLRHPKSVPACVLIAPAFDFLHKRTASLTEEQQANWKQTGRLRVQNEWVDAELGYGIVEESDQFPMEELTARLSRPTLIFHGFGDTAVPPRGSFDFVERAGYPEMELRFYKNGDHRLLAYREEMAEAACEFFARHVGGNVVTS